MEKCEREKCFGNIKGCCYVLTDTSGQDTCRFYREDLSYRQIMDETREKPVNVFFGRENVKDR